MPSTYSYPGVYVEEIPSGVRTITGVSTSNTAFVGFFAKGPVDEAVRITSFGDFERRFGGLDPRSEASYAVRQYFLNGGSVAWVIRVTASNAQAAGRTLQGGAYEALDVLTVTAASEGAWGNNVEVAIDQNVRASGVGSEFNLVVREVIRSGSTVEVVSQEVFRNLSVNTASSRYAEDAVNEDSALVRIELLSAGELPAPTGTDVVENAVDADFRALGAGGGTVGSDGFEPSSDNWINSEGAAAMRGSASAKSGIYALDTIAPEVFNLLCFPGAPYLSDQGAGVYGEAVTYCEGRRAFLIADIPSTVDTPTEMLGWMQTMSLQTRNAAVYFPRLTLADPLNENRSRNVSVSGTMAGIYARTDATRGIWKAPAGTEAVIRGADLAVRITDLENGALNPRGINALRSFPVYGRISWGARTLRGDDQLADEYKYIPVRRLALYIEESLFQGLQWVVFEPNDEPLWAQVRLNAGAFMNNLFRQSAFQGTSPREAYFVKCDRETTTQNDIDRGIVNIIIGFAPLKPAEFVVIKIQQIAGQIAA